MSKNKNKQFKNNDALPKTDVEFANKGLEKNLQIVPQKNDVFWGIQKLPSQN
ncbi:hypothetical protein [Peribacillus simplex]|uniref:hypothetical protein n=1 Tax=Peribacillus simplex TaxID=1478 RepID=UPI00162A15AE|nr:hypothetical protein [Peribacillus simplex]